MRDKISSYKNACKCFLKQDSASKTKLFKCMAFVFLKEKGTNTQSQKKKRQRVSRGHYMMSHCKALQLCSL